MSQYRIGTATFTQNSNVVTGQGTSWLSNVSAGNWIVRQGFGTTTYEAYQVASVASNTSLTLTVPYGGTTATAVAYVIAVDMLPNGIPELSNGDLETATIQNKANARLPAGLLGAAATYDVGTDANQLPRNSDLGTAAFTEASDYATSAQGGKADSAVQPSDLGTAATANVTTSATDTTAGRVLTVGAFGWGGLTSALSGVDANSLTVSGAYFVTNSTNMPTVDSYSLLVLPTFQSNRVVQVATLTYPAGTDQSVANRVREYVRVSTPDGIWSPWRELYHTGNLQVETSLGIGVVRIMKNVSGFGIQDQGTVSGGSLKAIIFEGTTLTESAVAVAGTWKNVGGAQCTVGATREFVRIA